MDDIPDYTEDELNKVALIQSLLKVGFETNALKRFFALCDENIEDRKEKSGCSENSDFGYWMKFMKNNNLWTKLII